MLYPPIFIAMILCSFCQKNAEERVKTKNFHKAGFYLLKHSMDNTILNRILRKILPKHNTIKLCTHFKGTSKVCIARINTEVQARDYSFKVDGTELAG